MANIESLQETSDIEECGVLIGRINNDNTITVNRAVRTKNTLPSQVSFEIDPSELFHIFNNLEKDEDIIAIYHTHPTSRARPSAWDKEYMEHASIVWIIAGIDTIAAYLWTENTVKKIDLKPL